MRSLRLLARGKIPEMDILAADVNPGPPTPEQRRPTRQASAMINQAMAMAMSSHQEPPSWAAMPGILAVLAAKVARETGT
jgi:hypothetical protein